MTDTDDADAPSITDEDVIPDAIADRIEQTNEVGRVYDAMLGIREPAPIEAVAELAHCNIEEAENTVEVLVELNVVTQITEDGETRYYRNEQFFQWLRASKLADEYDEDGLDELDETISTELRELKGIYTVTNPEDIVLPKQNEALQKRVRKDAMRWGVLEQTKTDIKIARMLQQEDPRE